MTKSDAALIRLGDIGVALALLTRLPLPGSPPFSRGAAAAWAYPLAGVCVAGIAAILGGAAVIAGLPAPFAALIALAALAALTGALHEDGLADTADGLWGGWTRERRLEIMRDSHIGTYGVIAVFLSMAWRYTALVMLLEVSVSGAITALLSAAALSRAGLPVLMAWLPHARDDGLSHGVGRARARTAALAVLVATGIGAVSIGPAVVPATLAACATTAAVGLVARRKIGGQTGDILGAAQQSAEIAVLTVLLT